MKNQILAAELEKKLRDYRVNGRPLPGISTRESLQTLVKQILDSISRVEYVKVVRERPISARRLDPKDGEMFDPLRAAILHMRNGNEDEAFWLVFLFVLCGKHLKKKYSLLRMVYGAFNDQFLWTWEEFSKDPQKFSFWLHQNIEEIERQRREFPFGNHRKYESLRKLDIVLSSYASWVGPSKSHKQLIDSAKAVAGDDPKRLFDYLYKSMSAVHRFGRVGKFDYLTMLGKIGLVEIRPPSAYLVDATGPVDGAKLLFGGVGGGNPTKRELDRLSIQLDQTLDVGMQVIEDALCNWQKNPNSYVGFRG
ncbi:MAG: alpha-glutamyl/putrescinyl thymine pyrophosphorylase clade 3 protein [Achromobacter pulmonis]